MGVKSTTCSRECEIGYAFCEEHGALNAPAEENIPHTKKSGRGLNRWAKTKMEAMCAKMFNDIRYGSFFAYWGDDEKKVVREMKHPFGLRTEVFPNTKFWSP